MSLEVLKLYPGEDVIHQDPEPALEIQIVPEDSEEIAVREGIHERIQAVMQSKQ